MARSFLIFSVALVALAAGCSKPVGGAMEALMAVKAHYGEGRVERARDCLSEGTRNGLADLSRRAPGFDEGALGIKKLFEAGTRWEIVREVSGHDTGEIEVKYTDAPSLSMKGFVFRFKLKKEGGAWKLDFEEEIRTVRSRL
jgi:hypothetical protein